MTVTKLAPSEIRFTQDSIQAEFGRDVGQSLEETFRELLYGVTSVEEIRKLSVVKYQKNHWVVSGNRRLYLYHKLQSVGSISEISVNVIPINMERFNAMKTTENNGMSVRVRGKSGGALFEARLNEIVRQWKAAGRPTDGQGFEIIGGSDGGSDSWCTIL